MKMQSRLAPLTAALATIAATAAPIQPAAPLVDSAAISGLGARNIGSAAMSGRIASLDALTLPDGKLMLYVGAASGGVWKSLDGGTTFTPVFDDQPVQSIGAVEIDRRNPETVWVGTGEAWTRNSVSIGNGVYRTTDGGDTWQNVGLPESERIAGLRIDPRASDTVYACVAGRLWSDSLDRGVYKTTDGGQTWQQVLKAPNASTGCADLSLDENNPDVLFASLWDFRRKGWTFRSGGESPTAASASALMMTRDGGRTWREITPEANKGFAQKPYGRIAVNVAPSDSKRIYAFVESPQSALYVSSDGGATWEARDRSQWLVWRPFYFARMTVDPTNPDRVFKDNGNLILSEDAGRSFSIVGGFDGMHGDIHDVWVNPRNPRHVISGDDGGLWQSHDGGSKWWKGENLPISQFYHVSVDDQDPYQVYGGLQDNSSWVGDSAYPGGITNSRWENMFGGDGFWMFSDPADPDYLYAEYQGGNLGRVNRLTHESRDIQPKARAGEKLRFNWNTPLHLSPNEKGTLYIGAQFLFRTRDHGQTWDRISPDLTTNDPQKQRQEETGGVTVDNSAAEMHTTIYSISESPRAAGTIWVGTDDGNLQLTRDGGKSWSNVVGNLRGLPKASWVSWVEASRHDAATAFATFDRHTFGDHAPYLYVTHDYGRSWQPLVTPQDPRGVRGYAHVIREDLQAPNLLFLGTEFGLWISVDAGKSWAAFKGKDFPAVAVRDLVVQPRDNDLVIATHGRGIWIVDDITPLRALGSELLAKDAAFVSARPVQQRIQGSGGWASGAATFVGDNPPNGAVITYYQRSRHLFGKLKLEVLDADGRVIDELPASKRRGLNRVVWSMREKPPRVPPAVQLAFAGTQGPRVLPGTYTVRMTKGGEVYEQPIEVGLDRRAQFTVADRRQQYDAAMRVHRLFGEESAVLDRIVRTRSAVDAAARQAVGDADAQAQLAALDAQLDEVRKRIVATREGGAITGEERLREHTDQLYGAIMSYDGAPAQYQLERIDVLEAELADIEQQFEGVVAQGLPDVNEALRKRGLPAVEVPPKVAAARDAGVPSANAHWLEARKRKDKKTKFVSLPQRALDW
ncbi:MAG: WD40/YVTN/BNR-like repeat-containing protein [Steroidobacteraceae bacterium]